MCLPSQDEQQEADERTDLCSGDTRETLPDLNHVQPSQPPGDACTSNGSPPKTESVCGTDSNSTGHTGTCDVGIGTSDTDPPLEPRSTREDDKKEEMCSPNPTANDHPANGRACPRRKRCLFTIQSVNSNGTTEIGVGNGESTVSISCESHACSHL